MAELTKEQRMLKEQLGTFEKARAALFASAKRCAEDLIANGRTRAHQHGVSDADCDTLLLWQAAGYPRTDEWLGMLVSSPKLGGVRVQ